MCYRIANKFPENASIDLRMRRQMRVLRICSKSAWLTVLNAGFKLTPGAFHRTPYGHRGACVNRHRFFEISTVVNVIGVSVLG